MRISRLLTAIPLLAICTISQGQEKYVVGKLGEAIDPAGIYSSPSTRSRVCKWVQANERLVVRKTSSPNWDAVLLQNGSYGYTKAGNIAELPYTVYAKHRGRTSNYASRGASPVVNQSTGSAIADKALQFQGTPYEWGGNDLYSGIDCSGFVKQLVGAIGGYNLPRTAAEQSLASS